MSYRVEVQFPKDFVRLNSIQPAPVLGADGAWYILIYGRPKDATQYHQHVFRWKPGTPAELVTMPTTDARGSIGTHASGGALFAWDGDGSYPRLMCSEIAGFVPAEGAGVAELRARVEELERRLAEIGTAPAGVTGAVRWVEAVRALG